MTCFELRTDLLTGVVTAHPDLRGKTYPTLVRTLAELPNGCPLCELANSTPNESGEILDGEIWRLLSRSSDYSLTVDNRWPPFGDFGRSDLVVARQHVTSLEEMDLEELADFVSQLLQTRSAHQQTYPRTLTSVNVGEYAGSTQPHLHGQVVSTEIVEHASVTPNPIFEVMQNDIALAREHGLVLEEINGSITYVAWAPTMTGELRVVAVDVPSLVYALHAALLRVESCIGAVPYNVIFHVEESLVAQVLLRVGHGSMYSLFFGITIVTTSPEELAKVLRTDF